MMHTELTKKMLAVAITLSLVILIFLIFTPSPSIAVHLDPGTPSPSSGSKGIIITFEHVNLTIPGPEVIIVNYLTFSIFNTNDDEIAYVDFSLNGTEIYPDYPLNKFTVINETDTSDFPNVSGGTYYVYDEQEGKNYTFNYGYGYGSGLTPLTTLYTITYTTHMTGTFYAQLFVNSTIHTFASGESTTFTVSSPPEPPPPGGGGGNEEPSDAPTAEAGGPYTGAIGTPIQFNGSESTTVEETTISSYSWSFGDGTTGVGVNPTHIYLTAGTYDVHLTVTNSIGATDTALTTATISSIAPPPPTIAVSNQIIQMLIANYGVNLIQPFYASDTNNDGIVDVLIDPNNILIATGFVIINGHATFLISIDNGFIPEFFWDTAANTITSITHIPASLTNPIINTTEHMVFIELTVEKTGWIFIDITDQYPIHQYPAYTLTVKAENRTISSDRIWRKDSKVYILDDPAIMYQLIYKYTILPPTFSPLTGTIITTSKPTITITYPNEVYMITAILDAANILDQITTMNNEVFTYTPSTDLLEGFHILSLTVQDDQGRYNLTSSSTFTVNLPTQGAFEIPWMIIIIITIVAIVIVIVIYLRMECYF